MKLTKKQVDKVGDELRLIHNDNDSPDILSAWCGNHVYPLNLAFKLLKKYTNKIGNNAFYGQRLK